MKNDFDSKMREYVKEEDNTKVTKTLDIINERFDIANRNIMNLEDSNRDLQVYLNDVKKDLSFKQNNDEFKDFKNTVQKLFATKEHIRELTLQMKGLSPMKQSEILEYRLNDLLKRVNDDYLAKYEIQDLINKSEEKMSSFLKFIIIGRQLVKVEDFAENNKQKEKEINKIVSEII